ncbi:MAG: hypothetical protein AAFZ18_39040 [Myxococcota bacterium]
MANPNTNVTSASFRLSTKATETRMTPKTDFGSVMRTGLIKAGQVASEGLQVAAPFVPGGTIVSAALAGANHAAGMVSGQSGAAAFGTTGSGLAVGGMSGNVSGGYGGGGAVLPGRRPGLTTGLDQPASNFATGGNQLGTGSDAFDRMMNATQQMAEFNASFNLQYLQLQEKIQVDTRQFNLISNIMKTKHDAAKNALNNVR